MTGMRHSHAKAGKNGKNLVHDHDHDGKGHSHGVDKQTTLRVVSRKAAAPKKAAGPVKKAVKKAAPGRTIQCPKCGSAVPFEGDDAVFKEHFKNCGELVKVVVMTTFTVRLEPDAEAQLPRLTPAQVKSHTNNALNNLVKLLKGKTGVREIFVRDA